MKNPRNLWIQALFLWAAAVPHPGRTQTPDSYLSQGNQAYEAGDYPQAAEDYQKAAQSNPQSAAAFQGLGNCRLRAGNKAEALADYAKALSLNPHNPALARVVEFLSKEEFAGATPTAPSPPSASTPPADLSAEVERQELDIETLKLEMERMRQAGDGDGGKAYRLGSSQKASDLAQAGKDRPELIVLDLANNEIWNEGVRFKLDQLAQLAKARGWPLRETLVKRDPQGQGRRLYAIGNISLLIYQGRDRGIFEVKAPSQPGDFDLATVEGISFQSSTGEIQKAFENLYFTYTGTETRNGSTLLEYRHGRDLTFDDRLEIVLDPSGKMTALRFGVLDEN